LLYNKQQIGRYLMVAYGKEEEEEEERKSRRVGGNFALISAGPGGTNGLSTAFGSGL